MIKRLMIVSILMLAASPAVAQEPPMCWALELLPGAYPGAQPKFIFGYPDLTTAYTAKNIILGYGEDAYDKNKRQLYEASDQYKIDQVRIKEQIAKDKKTNPDGLGAFSIGTSAVQVMVRYYENGRIFPAPCSKN